jgi:hypothetical protein
VEKYDRARQATDDNIVRRMRFACWITKATDTHSEYVISIAFPRQQWLRERASRLVYTYFAYLFINQHINCKARKNVAVYVNCISCIVAKENKITNNKEET